MKGFSLLELLVVLALIGLFILIATPEMKRIERSQGLENFAREVVFMLEKCRWRALQSRIYAGALIRKTENDYWMSFHLDGNGNGLRLSDIQSGTDSSFRQPLVLKQDAGDISTGILSSNVPQIPPRSGFLDPADPVRFGSSGIVSFSPDGNSSSGSIYLACYSQQQMYAIVLYGPTARIRLWHFRNHEWQMVEDR